MKHIILALAFSAAIITGAQAHIGWDLATCKAKYGEETKPTKTTNSGEISYFTAAGMNLSVIIRSDKVRSILYRKTSGEKFIDEEIDILQKKNQAEVLGAEGIEWAADYTAPKGTKIWYLVRQGKVELQALLNYNDPKETKVTVLEIRTWDQAAVETDAIKQDQEDKLKNL